MIYLRIFFIHYLIDIRATDQSLSLAGRVYNQMTYEAIGSSLAHLVITNKFICAAQCAHQFVTCNTAVFNSSSIPQCRLYSEVVMPGLLFISNTTIVYDFQQAKSKSKNLSIFDTKSLPFRGTYHEPYPYQEKRYLSIDIRDIFLVLINLCESSRSTSVRRISSDRYAHKISTSVCL